MKRAYRRPRKYGRKRTAVAAVAASPTATALLNVRTGGYLGIERKFLDVYASDVAVQAPTDASGAEIQPEGGCTGCLSAPAQGDGEQQRDGRKIVIKSAFVVVTVRPSVAQDAVDILASPVIYVALVLDTQTNGATIVSEQVFTNPNDTAYVNTYPIRNLQYSSRYRVLDHKIMNMGPATAGTDGANTNSINCNLRTCTLKYNGDLPVTFTNTTADVANVADNSLHIIAYATHTSMTPVLSYISRVRFVG